MFKEITADDVVSQRTTAYESLSLTNASFVSGSTTRYYDGSTWYHTSSSNYQYGGFYATPYNAAYALSTSYALFDITFGIDSASNMSPGFETSVIDNIDETKYRIYKEYQQNLLGNTDNAFTLPNGDIIKQAYFISLKRNIYRDGIKPGSIALYTYSASCGDNVRTTVGTYADTNAMSNIYKCHHGNYAPIYATGTSDIHGLAFYEAGTIVLSASAFAVLDDTFLSGTFWNNAVNSFYNNAQTVCSGTIDWNVSGALYHMWHLDFQNQVDIMSRIYALRLSPREFTYSSNPTFVDSTTGQIRTTVSSSAAISSKYSETYITATGLYDANGDLLAIGKLSIPIIKTWESAPTIRIRLDF